VNETGSIPTVIKMNDPFALHGKVALITGGSRGLGLQMAHAFAERGAHVLIASRKIEACEAVAADIRGRGGKASATFVNASHWSEMNRLADWAFAEGGYVDILVNNAGMSPAIPSHEVTESAFDKILSLNFKGPFRLAANIAHRMFLASGGAILNVSSTASTMPMPRVVPYAGAKAAINAMTVSLAREYGPKVRVNAIVAGPFLTDIAKAWTEEDRRTANNSVGRPGLPEEIVTTALYLASSASSYTTGAMVRCDGGTG